MSKKLSKKNNILSGKRLIFANAHLEGKTNRECFKLAKYKAKNVETMDAAAARLLGDVKVQAYIKERQAKIEDKTDNTKLKIMAELSKIAFSDIKNILSFGRGGVVLKDSEDVDGSIIAEASETVTEHGGTQRLKLHDKMKALELLGKHIGMFKDTIKHEVDDSVLKQFFDIKEM